MSDRISQRNEAIESALKQIFTDVKISSNNIKVWTNTPMYSDILNGVNHAKSLGYNSIFYTCDMKSEHFKNHILLTYGVQIFDKNDIKDKAEGLKRWDILDEISIAISSFSWSPFSFNN